MHTDTQELTVRDIHTNRPLIFKQAANGEVHIQFDAHSREASLDSGELLLAAQMLTAERPFPERDIKVALNNWLNGLIRQDELIKRLRPLFTVAVPAPRSGAPASAADQNAANASSPLQADTPMHTVIRDIILERQRQMELLAKGAIHYDCADPAVHPDRKLRAATEELGEIAEAIDLLEMEAARSGQPMLHSDSRKLSTIAILREELRRECIQIAAVCAAFAESLTEEPESVKRET